jgi:DNA-binding FadR family transcriptional regulator
LRFWSEDRQLHELTFVAAGNRRAAAIVHELRETTSLIGARTTSSARSLPVIGEEHAPIVAAIVERDALRHSPACTHT